MQKPKLQGAGPKRKRRFGAAILLAHVFTSSMFLFGNLALVTRPRAQSCLACCSQKSKEHQASNHAQTTQSVWPEDTRKRYDANKSRLAQSDSRCDSGDRECATAKQLRDTGKGLTDRGRRDTHEGHRNVCSNNSQSCLCRWAYA